MTLPPGILDVEIEAVMARYMREPPHPASLFHSPHTELSGRRILSRWFAGQLLDSALVREVAASDRLATLLWTRAGLSLRVTRKGREHRPAFTPEELRQLNPFYGHRDEWTELRALASNEFFTVAKALRDDWTHARRLVSELHGEQYRSYRDGPAIAAVNAADHLGIVLALYDAILRPAVELTGALLERAPTASEPSN